MQKLNQQKDDAPRIGIPFLSSQRAVCHISMDYTDATGQITSNEPPLEVVGAEYHRQVTWCGFLCGLGLGAAIASLIIGGFWL